LTEAARVVAPSDDTATRIRRHFPGLQSQIAPHSDDAASIAAARVVRRYSPRPLVCVVGAIGEHKGYDILLACGRDAKRRDLDLNFVVVGFSIDDARLLATERIFVTGQFASSEAVDLISEYKPNLGFVPSVSPETWCLALDDLWRSGLEVACFDIGAPAERIRRAKRGFVLPIGLPPNAINNALVAAIRTSGH
jgi:glycosyltransferase involved in cell wall biosynthesis